MISYNDVRHRSRDLDGVVVSLRSRKGERLNSLRHIAVLKTGSVLIHV